MSSVLVVYMRLYIVWFLSCKLLACQITFVICCRIFFFVSLLYHFFVMDTSSNKLEDNQPLCNVSLNGKTVIEAVVWWITLAMKVVNAYTKKLIISYLYHIHYWSLAIIWYGEDIQIYLYYNQLYWKFLVFNYIEWYAINIYSLENEKVKIEDMNNRKNRFVILQRNGFFSTM